MAGFFRFCEIYWEYRTAGHLVFWKPWPAVELKKVLSVTKHGFVLWAQRKPNTRLEIYKAIQDRLTFLNRHMNIWWKLRLARIFRFCEIYWEYRTASHLVFSTPWPVTGHIATAFLAKRVCFGTFNRTSTYLGEDFGMNTKSENVRWRSGLKGEWQVSSPIRRKPKKASVITAQTIKESLLLVCLTFIRGGKINLIYASLWVSGFWKYLPESA